MINPFLVDLFESKIQDWKPKQQRIANAFIVDKTYEIITIYDNNDPILYLKNLNNGSVINLEDYVKSKCNC
jgi:hypothetical protein